VEIVDGDGGTELECRSVIVGAVGVEVALKWAVGSGEKNRALTNQEMAGRTFCIFQKRWPTARGPAHAKSRQKDEDDKSSQIRFQSSPGCIYVDTTPYY
jgi:hypothetical protein